MVLKMPLNGPKWPKKAVFGQNFEKYFALWVAGASKRHFIKSGTICSVSKCDTDSSDDYFQLLCNMEVC